MANIIWTGLMGKTATTLGWQTNTVNFSPCQVTATVALASYGALMLGKAVALTLLGFAGWTYRRLTLRRIGQGGEAMLGRRCTPRHVMAGCGRTGFRDQRRSRRLRGLQLSTHKLEHMSLMIMVPFRFALGAPVTLAMRTLPAPTHGSSGPREVLLRWCTRLACPCRATPSWQQACSSSAR